MSCISAHDPQLERLADAIAQRVGPQRFHVWFNNSTRLDLKHDGLEIAVPNDFISDWIGTHFKLPIQEAAHEVLGCQLAVRFQVMPQLFEAKAQHAHEGNSGKNGASSKSPRQRDTAGPYPGSCAACRRCAIAHWWRGDALRAHGDRRVAIRT